MKIDKKFITHRFATFATFLYLGFIIALYYQLFSLSVPYFNLFVGILLLSILTDGLILFLHLPRSFAHHSPALFDSSKLSIVIACYNGEEVIGNTIADALVHIPASQIIVVSDASTDRTVEIARLYNVKVIENKQNLQKGLSISKGVEHVSTEYVLVLDDDTSIRNTFLPTSLLDKGYSAVAFNVMPHIVSSNFLNSLQRFEYRKSMIIGKSLRSSRGAVSNVSGAIGMFHTEDLKKQVDLHSGQYGGEDQQRTLMTHLISEKKGIVFYDSLVLTKAPDNLGSWLRQRIKRWNSSTQEIFFLSIRAIMSADTHYLLKLNRAYYLFLLLTEPLRMFLIITGLILFSPLQLFIIYLFYLFLDTLAWIKTGKKDSYLVVLFFPIYAKINMICRQFAHFYWIKKKYEYLVQRKWHFYVNERLLLMEYLAVLGILFVIVWPLSIYIFSANIFSFL